MSDTPGTTRHRFFGPFLWAVTGTGCLAFVYSCTRISFAQFDSRFAVLVAMALLLTSRVTVPIPRFSSQISVSDTFVFLVLLLYGAPAAIIVGSVEAFLSSLRFSRNPRIVAFNWASAAVSIFITSSVMEAVFGDVVILRAHPLTTRFAAALCTMALTHYAANSGVVAIGAALKTNQPIWQTWRKH
ncbi:MAG TPA: hypothetical protein VGJ37_06645, partial [Pyrinomonadaceae bacterium]